jgi:hypothetical protein
VLMSGLWAMGSNILAVFLEAVGGRRSLNRIPPPPVPVEQSTSRVRYVASTARDLPIT